MQVQRDVGVDVAAASGLHVGRREKRSRRFRPLGRPATAESRRPPGRRSGARPAELVRPPAARYGASPAFPGMTPSDCRLDPPCSGSLRRAVAVARLRGRRPRSQVAQRHADTALSPASGACRHSSVETGTRRSDGLPGSARLPPIGVHTGPDETDRSSGARFAAPRQPLAPVALGRTSLSGAAPRRTRSGPRPGCHEACRKPTVLAPDQWGQNAHRRARTERREARLATRRPDLTTTGGCETDNYWIGERGVASSRRTEMLSRLIISPTCGAISFFQ